MRIFAGPNGSGKSTIIEAVKKYKIKGLPIDFGIYINADNIAKALKEDSFSFKDYDIAVSELDFIETTLKSGLINKQFTEARFKQSYEWLREGIRLKNEKDGERVAQILADFIRKKLLESKKKFSFETVFSHKSKLDVMKEALDKGYKVYLYFVATEDPEINKLRVKSRVKQHGHPVPPDKIESRYYRSLDLLYDAAQLAYQCYFFDNSEAQFKLIAHFKKEHDKKKWDKIKEEKTNWFIKYYSDKINK